MAPDDTTSTSRFSLVQGGDIGGERIEPVALEPAGGGVHQQRGADLDDDTAEILE